MKRVSNVVTQLKEERLRQGLSQKQLAERCGKAQPAIARIEGGLASPSIKNFERVCRALGMELVVIPSLTPKEEVLKNHTESKNKTIRNRVL
ncbi:MAG: helix-turn-helix transcriptional regulator [Bacilli bacterium]|nr:helix-turn-helix transcriptional regulator [Bacilli bacterium]